MADLFVAEALAGVDHDDAEAFFAGSGSPAAAVNITLKMRERVRRPMNTPLSKRGIRVGFCPFGLDLAIEMRTNIV